jgi:Family of unknown function (DUF6941)
VARIESAHLCQLAFLDDCGRLCLIGVITRLPIPSLPLAVAQMMIAARIVDIRPGETIGVNLTMTTPSGRPPADGSHEDPEIDFAGEYVLIKIHGFPLTEEGVYHVGLSIGGGQPVTFELPVFLTQETQQARIH